jgi:hypothetical protein
MCSWSHALWRGWIDWYSSRGFDLCLDISDFLTEEIKGPASFNCNGKKNGCKFEEPAMNDLIGSVFGDKSIFLNCESSECLYYTQVPGYQVC